MPEGVTLFQDTLIKSLKYGFVNEASYDYDFGTVVMKTYHAKLLSGKLELLEHQNSTWLAPHELKSLNWAPVDRPAVELLTKK